MFKIYLAVAHQGLEKFLESNKLLIEKKLNDEVDFVGTAVYREGIIQGIKDYHPDVVIVREGIPGSLSLTDLVYQIKIISPTTRIIFIAGDRKPGDAFLATLVQYGVYDILIGNKVNVKDMVKKILYPNKMADVIELMPKIKLTDDGKQLYEAPDIGLLRPMLDEQNSDVNIQPLSDLSKIEEDEPIKIEEESSIPTQKIELPITKEPINDDLDDEPINIESDEKPIIEEVKPIEHKKENKIGLFGRKQQKESNILKPLVEEEVKETPLPSLMEQSPIVETPINQPIKPTQSIEKPIVEPYVQPIEKTSETILNIPTENNIDEKKQVIDIPIQKPIIQQPIVQQPTQEQPYINNPYVNQNPFINNQNPYGNYQQNFDEQQMGYGNMNPMFTPRVNISQNSEQQKRGLFGSKKNNQKTVAQQIITFVGGRHGSGNSQIAFSTALLLAEQGYKTLYMDLNEEFASIESILECGFDDLGIDTMLEDIKIGNYPHLVDAINSSSKALSYMDKKDSMYRTYSKLPPKLEFTSFSMNILNRKKEKDYDINLLKELNMFLLMNLNYDMIILDAPSNIYSEITKIAMIYSNRIFFTLTQDIADTECFMRSMKNAEISKVGYKDKSNFICNKYVSHTENEVSTIQNQLINFLKFDTFKIINVPNVYTDIINASSSNVPLLWKSKDKNLKKGIQDIVDLILN